MSKDKKTVMCGGFAFSEERDMKKLSKLAKKGWILHSFKNLSYQLKKSEPQDLIYCVDYKDKKEDLDTYFDIFEDSEWKHVCSYDCYHFFKAPTGTAPIYTDTETRDTKYKWIYKEINKTILISIIIAVITGFIASKIPEANDQDSIFTIRLLIYMICGGAIGMAGSLIVGNYLVKRRITNKNK